MDHYGGFYADIDTTCLRPMDEFSAYPGTPQIILGLDTIRRRGKVARQEYQQWFLASTPGHPIWRYVLDVITERCQQIPILPFTTLSDKQKDTRTLWLTGPQAFTEGVTRYLREVGTSDILTLNANLLGNYGSRRDQVNPYLIHHYQGSWKQNWRHQNWKLPNQSRRGRKDADKREYSELVSTLTASVVIQAMTDLFATDPT
jgi:mannosyltransferase OCH1-like enzyme